MSAPLTPEEQARLAAMLKEQGAPGVVTYDAEPVVVDGQPRFVQAPPPAIAPGVDPLDAATHVDAFAASRGAAQQQRDAMVKPPEPSAREQYLAAHQDQRQPDDGPAPPQPGQPAQAAPDAQAQDQGVPVARPQFVPGGWFPTSRTGRLPIDEGIKQEVAGADALHEQAIEQWRDAGTEQAQGERAHFENLSRGVRGVDTQIARNEGNRESDQRIARMKLEDLTDQVAQAKDIDPYARMSSGSKMMAILGVALGGFGAGMRGAPNQAMAAYQRAIDQEIETQKANLANKRGAVADQRGYLAAMKEQFGDERQAEQAAKIAYLSRAEMDLKALAAQSKSKEVQARATELLGELQDKRAQRMLQLQQLEQGQLHEAYQRPGYVGGSAAQQIDPGRIVRMPDGSVRVMPTVPEGTKAREGAGTVSNIQANLDEALRLRSEASALDLANPYSGVNKRLQSLQAETSQMVTVARGQGAMSKGDQEVADTAIGSMTGILGSNDEVLKSTRDRFGKQFERQVTAEGGEHARAGYGLDAHGRVVPQQAYTGQADQPAPVVRQVKRTPIGGQ